MSKSIKRNGNKADSLFYYMDNRGVPHKTDDIYKWRATLISDKWHMDTLFSKGLRVSTVFIGIDASLGRAKKPLLFETMVFGGSDDGARRKYPTWKEAKKGHKEAVMVLGQIV